MSRLFWEDIIVISHVFRVYTNFSGSFPKQSLTLLAPKTVSEKLQKSSPTLRQLVNRRISWSFSSRVLSAWWLGAPVKVVEEVRNYTRDPKTNSLPLKIGETPKRTVVSGRVIMKHVFCGGILHV